MGPRGGGGGPSHAEAVGGLVGWLGGSVCGGAFVDGGIDLGSLEMRI